MAEHLDTTVREDDDKPIKCDACNGRGYLRCDCWLGDCICGYDEEPCEECDGTGWIEPWGWYHE